MVNIFIQLVFRCSEFDADHFGGFPVGPGIINFEIPFRGIILVKISAHGEIHSARRIFPHLFAPNLAGSFAAFAFLKGIAPISDLIPFIPIKISVFRADRHTEPGVFILDLLAKSLPEKWGAIFTLAVIMSAAADVISKC